MRTVRRSGFLAFLCTGPLYWRQHAANTPHTGLVREQQAPVLQLVLREQPRAGSTRQLCTGARPRPGVKSKPGRDGHEPRAAQGWLKSLTLRYLLQSPPCPSSLPSDQGPLSGREKDALGRAGAQQDEPLEAQDQEALHSCTSGSLPARQTCHLCTRLLLVPGLDPQALPSGFLGRSWPFPDDHYFPALPSHGATLLPEHFLPHCFLPRGPIWKRG